MIKERSQEKLTSSTRPHDTLKRTNSSYTPQTRSKQMKRARSTPRAPLVRAVSSKEATEGAIQKAKEVIQEAMNKVPSSSKYSAGTPPRAVPPQKSKENLGPEFYTSSFPSDLMNNSATPPASLRKEVFRVKEISQKSNRALEEFWKKISGKKDLSGKIECNTPLFWYILWKAEFDVVTMIKNYDLYQFEAQNTFGDEPMFLSKAHKQMSKWFAQAWDQNHNGLLDWYDFSYGWLLATQGGEKKEVLSFLFRAMDRDNDSYVKSTEVIEYCNSALDVSANPFENDHLDGLSQLVVANVVNSIFDDMARGGPFDVITEEEFIEYAEKNPESIFATWGRLLQWKCLSIAYPQRHPSSVSAESPIKVVHVPNRKQMQRSKTDGAHGVIAKADEIIKNEKEKSESETKLSVPGRILVSPRKERVTLAKSSPPMESDESPSGKSRRKIRSLKSAVFYHTQSERPIPVVSEKLTLLDGSVVDLETMDEGGDTHVKQLAPKFV